MKPPVPSTLTVRDGSAVNGGKPSVVSFDHFEVDLDRRLLRSSGHDVKLQEKPFLLLEALLDRPGEIVTREELYSILWPEAQHLDFDASLNVAARKLRQALGDSTREPRWLETVPRRGYRLDGSGGVVGGFRELWGAPPSRCGGGRGDLGGGRGRDAVVVVEAVT